MPEMIPDPPAAAPPALRPVARLLPPEEWAERTPALAVLPPAASFVLVVEDGGPGGALLAQWGALTVVHVEGLEFAPVAHGHAGVGRALLSAMIAELTRQGVPEVLTQAADPGIAALCEKAGGHKVPGDTWVIPLAGVDPSEE